MPPNTDGFLVAPMPKLGHGATPRVRGLLQNFEAQLSGNNTGAGSPPTIAELNAMWGGLNTWCLANIAEIEGRVNATGGAGAGSSR